MIITLVAVFLGKTLKFWIAVLSSAMQLLWLAITQDHVAPSDSGAELLFRLAEPLGIVLGAVVAVLLVRGMLPPPAKHNDHSAETKEPIAR